MQINRLNFNELFFEGSEVEVKWQRIALPHHRYGIYSRAEQGRLSLSSLLQWVDKRVLSLFWDINTGDLASDCPSDRYICSYTEAPNGHVFREGDSRPWSSWAVAALSSSF
ncbi:hypothetical protein TNCV_3184831 [Trichonephila clavipes]|nr:hypothetical protein TNCV_3184831 [Trichonephila clavipes]